MGGPRRRLLPRQEVQGRPAGAARPPGLVQVGGVHDLALGLRPDGRPLLLQRERVPDRPARSPTSSSWEAVGISIALLVAAWLVYDVLCRLLLPRGRNGEIALWALLILLTTLAAWGCGELFQPRAAFLQVGAMLGTIMAGERLLQHHPRPLGADQRQEGRPRARPDAGDHGEEALGPQQLLHAAGAVHDARRALRVRLRRRPRLARADRDHAARRLARRVLQPAPPGPHDLGDAGRSASSASLLLALGDQAGRRRQRRHHDRRSRSRRWRR